MEFTLDESTEFALLIEFQYLYLASERRLDDPDESFDDAPPTRSGDERVEAVSELVDNGSLLGLEGAHTTGDGLSAYFYVEWEFAGDEEAGGLDQTGDSYIGIAGDFGELRLGNWDGIYIEGITDLINPFEYEGITELNDGADAGDQLSWFSPRFNGFAIAVETLLKGDGAGLDPDEDGDADAVYPLVVVVGYEAGDVGVNLAYDDRALLGEQADAQLGVGVAFDLEPFSLALTLEQAGDSGDGADDALQAWGVLGGWDYGAGTVAIALQHIRFDRELADVRENRTEYLLHVGHELSEHLVLYAEGARYGRFDDFGDYAGVGAVLNF